MKTSVGICTYNRAHVLQTLDSIINQKTDSIAIHEIIVVDNDINRSAESIILKTAERTSIPIVYIHEPQKNIAAARNRILDAATGDWLALLDDDEVANPDWLAKFISIAQSNSSIAYFGPVISRYAAHCPQWISQGKFFCRKSYSTNVTVQTGCTANAFINLQAINAINHRFELTYGLTGGEDSHFFYQLYKTGNMLTWCKDAIVSEEVEAHRLNEQFLMKKSQRIGETYSRYRYKLMSTHDRAGYIAKSLVICSIGSCISFLFWPFQSNVNAKIFMMRFKLRAADAKGKLKGISGGNLIELYGADRAESRV